MTILAAMSSRHKEYSESGPFEQVPLLQGPEARLSQANGYEEENQQPPLKRNGQWDPPSVS